MVGTVYNATEHCHLKGPKFQAEMYCSMVQVMENASQQQAMYNQLRETHTQQQNGDKTDELEELIESVCALALFNCVTRVVVQVNTIRKEQKLEPVIK